MENKILEKMKKGVYYPGNHLGKRHELAELVKLILIMSGKYTMDRYPMFRQGVEHRLV